MIKRLLSRRIDIEREKEKERSGGAVVRRFKLDIKNRFVMILVYYNYT